MNKQRKNNNNLGFLHVFFPKEFNSVKQRLRRTHNIIQTTIRQMCNCSEVIFKRFIYSTQNIMLSGIKLLEI